MKRLNYLIRDVLISAVLALLIVVAFEPVRHNGFVDYDDNQYLTENAHVQPGFTRDSITWAFTSGYASNWHPLTWLSHMTDIEWFGLNPVGHHLHNVLLHIVATILLFHVLKAMTGGAWCSAFVAMAFGLHPLRVESVVWASERKDVLAAVFWMLTMAAYVRYARRGGIGTYLLVVLCFALGLMAKPMLVTLPVILLILDFWPLRRASNIDAPANGTFRRAPVRRLIVEKIPLLGLALVSSVVTVLVQHHARSIGFDVPLALRLSNALTSYVAYLGNTLFPHNFGALLYPYPTEWPLWKPLVAMLVLAAISGVAIWRSATKSHLIVGWLWYIVTLLPVIGLIQVGSQSMADRYSYLPSIGIFIMVAWTAAQWSAHQRRRELVLGVVVAALAFGMMNQTRTQTTYWKDSITLFEHALAVTKNNYKMHYNLGWTLARQNRFDEATTHFNEALRLLPDYPDANLDLADLLIKHGRLDEAMVHLNRVLRVESDNGLAWYNRGVILQSQTHPDEAIAAYERAIQLDPANARALNNLGMLKVEKGMLDDATECYTQALRLNPHKAEAHRNLAVVLQLQNRGADALAHYQNSLELKPDDPETSWGLAYTLHTQGRFKEAAHYDRYTLRLKPDHVPALNDLAWILAAAPDADLRRSADAISLALKACELTSFREPDLLDTLAVAFAAANRFAEAADAASKAIDLAKAAGQQDLAREIEKRLRLYRASTAYVDPPPTLAASQ